MTLEVTVYRRFGVVGLAMLAAWQPTCDAPSSAEPLDVGTVELPLETTSDGVTYRLLPGRLLFFELGERTPLLEIDDFTPSILSVPLAPGRYVVELVDGRLISEETQTEVDAVLLSEARQEVHVLPGQAATVTYRFALVDRGDPGGDPAVAISGTLFPDQTEGSYAEVVAPLDFDLDFLLEGATYPAPPWGVGTQTVTYDAGPVTLALGHQALDALASDITGTEPTFFMAITYGDGRPGTIDLFLGVGEHRMTVRVHNAPKVDGLVVLAPFEGLCTVRLSRPSPSGEGGSSLTSTSRPCRITL